MTERDLVVGSASPPTADVPTEREQLISLVLKEVDERLAALDFAWFGGLPYVEREQIFAVVNETSRACIGFNWARVRRWFEVDHSGEAGEPEATTKEAPQIVQDAAPTQDPVPTPDQGPAVTTAGGVTVPDEALDVALTARRLHQFRDQHTCRCGFGPADGAAWDRHMVEVAVTAAAPLIAAQALRSAAEEFGRRARLFDSLPLGGTADWLNRRADELERGDDR